MEKNMFLHAFGWSIIQVRLLENEFYEQKNHSDKDNIQNVFLDMKNYQREINMEILLRRNYHYTYPWRVREAEGCTGSVWDGVHFLCWSPGDTMF